MQTAAPLRGPAGEGPSSVESSTCLCLISLVQDPLQHGQLGLTVAVDLRLTQLEGLYSQIKVVCEMRASGWGTLWCHSGLSSMY